MEAIDVTRKQLEIPSFDDTGIAWGVSYLLGQPKLLFVVLVDEKNAQVIALRAVKDKLRNELAGIRDIHHVGVILMNLDKAFKTADLSPTDFNSRSLYWKII